MATTLHEININNGLITMCLEKPYGWVPYVYNILSVACSNDNGLILDNKATLTETNSYYFLMVNST